MRRALHTRLGLPGLAVIGVLLTGCADTGEMPAEPADDRAVSSAQPAPRTPAPAQRRGLEACGQTPPAGRVVRSGYGLDYSSGSIHVAVTPYAGPGAACVEFAKSGADDPQVPPDTLLFTFAAPNGEGAQVEFDTVALTGGVLPPLGNGYVPKVGPLDYPINARVGASIGGTYYFADQCALLLRTVTAEGASGRFDCAAAATRAANPFAPSDDVDYNLDDTVPPPPTAVLSGWFSVKH
ncbi:hypothetical protein MUG78_09875 [Gordonia alkaliphila]|uniref:hypothetical protein n=1 Tax=Gordonia alkaliphila TaxID=1053547 RepID=UPI001FF5BCE1|nr:hypothetical protein [Gordonia alkaliphila]MCK0439757.1 hypothetical protein [Gordonia alkaliphila]